ncbi:MAG: hypothetical protein AVDCRST_MAG20-519 [uncultured Acidimicrobiales bacterium]|uniref:Transglycosylase SLT domain-containing protein n=1 Tax=uncultured Acidimicrobiales bacterium TaxID=310071 RepID=A0A6J4HCE5_9ACTN|nr:MAG: hypothetical protein AVDCRST_MAG20-519 [uncultured Acidimicrobiales bacterium]
MPSPRLFKRASAAVTLLATLVVSATVVGASPASAATDMTYAGEQLSITETIQSAHAGGFHTEEQLLTATSIAIAESSLYSGLRNWHPEFGNQPAGTQLGVAGPGWVYAADGSQSHADRGLYQINSYWWPAISDATADDPVQAARAMYDISSAGTSFGAWHTFTSGEAQRHWDAPYNGWPALRPLVREFLAGGAAQAAPVQAAAVQAAPVQAAPVQAAPVQAAPAPAAAHEIQQVLGMGGTLYKMAIQHYGNGDAWPYIAARNGILVPEDLLAEQVIIIP